jgi:hypothetical protein
VASRQRKGNSARVAVGTHHAHNGAGGHVLDEAGEELLCLEVVVVSLHVGLAGGGKLHGHELETFSLEALDDLADQTTLDAVGLDHDVGALVVGHVSKLEEDKPRDDRKSESRKVSISRKRPGR